MTGVKLKNQEVTRRVIMVLVQDIPLHRTLEGEKRGTLRSRGPKTDIQENKVMGSIRVRRKIGPNVGVAE